MKTETILIVILIVLITAVVAVVMMNQGTGDVEKLQSLRDEVQEMKESEVASELEKLRNDIKDLKEDVSVDEPESIVEDAEDEIVYLKSVATMDVQSPDIEKNNFPIEPDEVRASVMENQNIVENDDDKNSEDDESSLIPIITTGPESLQIPKSMMEKIQAAARKAKEKEKNDEIKKIIDRPESETQRPTPELIRMGPPSKIIQPAVCRPIPGSSFDTCGRPTNPTFPMNEVVPMNPPGKKMEIEEEEKELNEQGDQEMEREVPDPDVEPAILPRRARLRQSNAEADAEIAAYRAATQVQV
jgi:HAMP domain-containing protein